MQFELKSLQKQLNYTFIYVTHDQEEALTMSDRIAVMNEGIIDQLATPEEIYNNPSTEFVAGFIGDINKLNGKIVAQNQLVCNGQNIVANTKNIAAGTAVKIFLRPENIFITESNNGMPGKIIQSVFAGTHTKLEIELSDGIIVHINESVNLDRRYVHGDTVRLEIKQYTAIIFE